MRLCTLTTLWLAVPCSACCSAVPGAQSSTLDPEPAVASTQPSTSGAPSGKVASQPARSGTPSPASKSSAAGVGVAPEPSAAPSAELSERNPSAPPSGNVKTLFVKPERVDCVGEGPMKCLQVREGERGEYFWFYDSIEGFSFEEGNLYELKVEVSSAEASPEDGSSLRYRLIEVMSKRPSP